MRNWKEKGEDAREGKIQSVREKFRFGLYLLR